MFISEAFASTAQASVGQTPFSGFLIQMVLVFAIFYFIIIRPQQKKMKEHEDMLAAIKPNDEIITGGGIYGKVVKTVFKTTMDKPSLKAEVSSNVLEEKNSYDVAAVRIRAVDENGNTLAFCGEALELSVEGPIELIGPKIVPLRGGMTGTYVKTIGETGNAILNISNPQLGSVKIAFEVKGQK